jgi:hypothetical protein
MISMSPIRKAELHVSTISTVITGAGRLPEEKRNIGNIGTSIKL